MPRIPRLLHLGESATYHVISRTALPGFVLGDVEKEHLVQRLRRLCGVYFAAALGFCVMGNPLHLLVRMHTGEDVSHEEIRHRFRLYYGADSKRALADGQIPAQRGKRASLAELVKEVKQSFSRWFNKTHGRSGFFWGERFKSVLVEDGDTLPIGKYVQRAALASSAVSLCGDLVAQCRTSLSPSLRPPDPPSRLSRRLERLPSNEHCPLKFLPREFTERLAYQKGAPTHSLTGQMANVIL